MNMRLSTPFLRAREPFVTPFAETVVNHFPQHIPFRQVFPLRSAYGQQAQEHELSVLPE
jgi:hypothetical protein